MLREVLGQEAGDLAERRELLHSAAALLFLLERGRFLVSRRKWPNGDGKNVQTRCPLSQKCLEGLLWVTSLEKEGGKFLPFFLTILTALQKPRTAANLSF